MTFGTGCSPTGGAKAVRNIPVTSLPLDNRDEPADKHAPTKDAYYYYLAAQEAMNSGQVGQAEEFLKKAIAADPYSAELKVELAAIYLRKQKIDNALSLVEKALVVAPDNLPALRLKGGLLYRQGDFTKAAAAYEKALALEPRQQGVYIVLGRLYLDRQRWSDASRVFSKMVKVFPQDYTGHYYLARALEGAGDLEGAKNSYLNTLDLSPALEEPRWHLIEIFEKQQQLTLAIEQCRRLLSYNPANYRAAMALSLLQRRLGREAEAVHSLEELGRLAEHNPEILQPLVRYYLDKRKYDQSIWLLKAMLRGDPASSALHYVLGVTYDAIDKPLSALEHFKKVRSSSEFYENATIQIASLFQQLKRLDEGIAYLESVISNNKAKADYYLYLAGFYEQKKQYRKAIEKLESGLSLDKDNYRLYFRLGVVYDKLGRKKDSIAAMRRVLELQPEDPSALNYLGYTFADLGINLEEAEKLIRKALKLKPNDGYITDSLAWVFYKQGRYGDALAWMRKAVELVPDDPVIMEHLGDVFLKLDKRQKALDAFLRSRRLRKDKKSKSLDKKIEKLQKGRGKAID